MPTTAGSVQYDKTLHKVKQYEYIKQTTPELTQGAPFINKDKR